MSRQATFAGIRAAPPSGGTSAPAALVPKNGAVWVLGKGGEECLVAQCGTEDVTFLEL